MTFPFSGAMRKTVLLYGLALALLVTLLKFLEYHYFVRDLSLEFYLALIAILCTAVGIWAGLRLTRRRTPATITHQSFINQELVKSLNISKRELDVLKLMVEGLSNQEIADKLFVSLNTVKTHASNLFVKLDVKRRTQAIQKAKEMNLV